VVLSVMRIVGVGLGGMVRGGLVVGWVVGSVVGAVVVTGRVVGGW
jgi:hypothetical protein